MPDVKLFSQETLQRLKRNIRNQACPSVHPDLTAIICYFWSFERHFNDGQIYLFPYWLGYMVQGYCKQYILMQSKLAWGQSTKFPLKYSVMQDFPKFTWNCMYIHIFVCSFSNLRPKTSALVAKLLSWQVTHWLWHWDNAVTLAPKKPFLHRWRKRTVYRGNSKSPYQTTYIIGKLWSRQFCESEFGGKYRLHI